MRQIKAALITKAVEKVFIKINLDLPSDMLSTLKSSLKKETNKTAKAVLSTLLENAAIAKKENIPICQDTGLAVIFAEIGQDVHISGGSFTQAINKGIRNAVKNGYLRASVVKDPVNRINTKDNTPAVIHTQIVPGNKIKLYILAKGGGAENMSALKMLKPSDGIEGIKDLVIETVKKAGPNPCPPIIVGVGIGGNFEKCACLAKKALLRKIRTGADVETHCNASLHNLETDLLNKINKLGIGPSGFGGKTTCLAVNIESLPCHIASLPVAVNIECHAHRHGEVVI